MSTFAEIAARDVNDLRRRQSAIENRRRDLASSPADDDLALSSVRDRYDPAYAALGAGGSPANLPSESAHSYRRRLAAEIQRFSPEWRDANLHAFSDDVLDAAEGQIIKDVRAAVHDKVLGNSDGSLREVKVGDAGGHEVTTFHGNPAVWLSRWGGPARTVRRFIDPKTGQSLATQRRTI